MNTLINPAARIAVLALATMLSFSATGATTSTPAAAPLTQSYVWHDGSRERTVWLNPQAVAEINPSNASASVAKNINPNAKVLPLKHNQSGMRIWQIDNTGGAAVRSMAATNPTGKYSPVFHDSASSGGAMRALPGNIIVYLNPTWDAATVDNWIKLHKLEVLKKLEAGPNIYLIKTAPGLDALDTANTLYQSGEVVAAFPDWWREVSTR